MRALVFPILMALMFFSGATSASAKWQTACSKQACELKQTLTNNKGKQIASVVMPMQLKDKAPRQLGFVLLPLGIHIPSSVKVRVDSSKRLVPATLLDCDLASGCRAVFEMTPRTLKSFKAARSVSFTVVDGIRQRAVTFKFTLAGFTKAHGKFARAIVARRDAK